MQIKHTVIKIQQTHTTKIGAKRHNNITSRMELVDL